jgi:rRNA-processing protein FCF1
MMKCVVILDTSALFIVAENLATLDSIYETTSECEVAVIRNVVEELENIAKRGHGRKALLAEWILQNLIPKFKVLDTGFQGRADDAILDYACELMKRGMRSIVVTSDGEVKERALRKGIEIIVYRESEKVFEIL